MPFKLGEIVVRAEASREEPDVFRLPFREFHPLVDVDVGGCRARFAASNIPFQRSERLPAGLLLVLNVELILLDIARRFRLRRPQDGGLGLPPKVVQERMGHSSITMTMDVYGHLFPRGDDAEELAAAEAALLA